MHGASMEGLLFAGHAFQGAEWSTPTAHCAPLWGLGQFSQKRVSPIIGPRQNLQILLDRWGCLGMGKLTYPSADDYSPPVRPETEEVGWMVQWVESLAPRFV